MSKEADDKNEHKLRQRPTAANGSSASKTTDNGNSNGHPVSGNGVNKQQQQQQQQQEEEQQSKTKKHHHDHIGEGTVSEALQHLALFVFSHAICYYLWWSVEFNHGCIGNPFPIQSEVWERATPNTISIRMYFTLIIGHLIGAAILPGPIVKGFKIPQENNRRLDYLCNALSAWYIA